MRLNIGRGTFIMGDCLERMVEIPDGSIDMILCDLPYGTTQNKWDSVIPFDALWSHYWRIAKPNAAVVLTAAQPFTSALVMSQIERFKYDWIWRKSHATGHLNANRMPMREHEHVTVFARNTPIYNAQKFLKDKTKVRPEKKGAQTKTSSYGQNDPNAPRTDENTIGFPKSVIEFGSAKTEGKPQHPTQKPVALFEYLIRTYTNEGDTVLDNCAGSGTAAIAAEQSGRNWICIERDPTYYCAAVARVVEAVR